MQRILFLILIMFAGVAHGAADWELRRLGGRDYVTLDNVARFYGLQPTELPEEGVRPASNRKTQHLENARGELQVKAGSREAVINGVKQWFSFPVREENGQLLISRIDLAKTIEPMLRPQRVENLAPVATVVIDPGHGGHDRGAVNKFGDEKTYTLDVGLRLKAILEAKGINVVMTRDRDVFIPLEERPKVANSIPNSIFVSIHFNAGGAHANGFEIFAITPRGAPSTADEVLRPRDFREEPGNAHDVQSAVLASSVYHSMLGHFADFDRGLKRARFAVLRLAEVPAILVEGGFISNPNDAQFIDSPAWRQNLAESIAQGIVAYKKLAEIRKPPELIADYRSGYGRPSWEGESTLDLARMARHVSEDEEAFTLYASNLTDSEADEPVVEDHHPAPKITPPVTNSQAEEAEAAGQNPVEFYFEGTPEGFEPVILQLGMGTPVYEWNETSIVATSAVGAETSGRRLEGDEMIPLLAVLLLASGVAARFV